MAAKPEDYPPDVQEKLDMLRECTRRIDKDRDLRVDLIIELRRDHGVTSELVAEHAGVTPAMVWQILNPKPKKNSASVAR